MEPIQPGAYYWCAKCAECDAVAPLRRAESLLPWITAPEDLAAGDVRCPRCSHALKGDLLRFFRTVPVPASPQSALFADKPGSYEVVTRASRPIVEPGHDLEVEVLITGYGRIMSSKLMFSASPGIIDESASRVAHSLRRGELTGEFSFGGRTDETSDGGAFGLAGMRADHWQCPPTLFVDARTPVLEEPGTHCPVILTERRPHGNPPFKWTFRLRRQAPPGIHSVRFYFTYYDGERWRTSVSDVAFHILCTFERYAGVLTIAGVALGLAGLGSLVLDFLTFRRGG
ncbi:MAG: hypothetical protein IPK85_09065 [Gemmatimonadetes bacterium]|nr:hypothetical protein [Gemmatimonadota bacterium]